VLFYAGICQESEQKKMPQNTCKARNINPFKRFQDMTRILFVCHGNICRSPMAEFVMKDLVEKAGLETEFLIESAATSTEEIGNPVYPPARRKLAEHGISCAGKTSRQLIRADYGQYDLLIGMDRANIRNMNRICGGDPEGKLHLLMEYTDHPGDVADPWYTGDFETTWRDVLAGCLGLLQAVKEERL
jgi:protein-tyrosine phosphatase